jgi:hypothetical protein
LHVAACQHRLVAIAAARACAHQAVVDALVLMQSGRALAARRVLETLEEDLSQVAALTRRWAESIANEAAGEPS